MAARSFDGRSYVSNGDAVDLERWDYAPSDGQAFVLREIRRAKASLDAAARLERAMKRIEDGTARAQEHDLVRDGVHELRVQADKRWYRLLWGRHGNRLVALSFLVKKSNRLPKADVEVAIQRLQNYTRK